MAKEQTQHNFRSDDLNNILSIIDNGIIIVNDALTIFHYNSWLEIHTKLKEEDLLGKTLDEVFPTINAKTLKRKIKTCLSMNSPAFYAAETTKYLIPIKINQLKVTDFENMRQDVRVVPFDQDERLVAIIITDQTNMINTQKQLQQSIQRVHELNQETLRERKTIDERINLIKINSEFVITNASQAYLNLLDLQKDQIINKNLFEFEGVNISPELKEQIILHTQEQKVFKYEQISNSKNGKEFWLYHTLVPDYDKHGEHNGFIIFGDDITDAKLVQKHQEKLLESSRSAAMGEMISMIAHQWRQPLSVVNTIIASLKVKKELGMLTDDIQQSSFDKIEQTIGFLSETIDDFRNFFKQNKELVETNILFLFEKSVSFIKEEIEKNEINYTQEIEQDINIYTYQNELIQSIINIIKNSIDAFKEKEHDNKILHVRATQNDNNIRIEIKDNAGGIDSEILAKVFEPYFSTKSKNGTGLGLYMCKTIIEDHLSGKLTMQSVDQETKTIIELPKNISNKE